MFIVNWVEDKVAGYAKTGIQAGGTLAGNTVGGVGGLIENAGRSAGDGVSGGVGKVGSYFHGYGDNIKRSMSADGPVTGQEKKKTAVKPPTSKPSPAQKALPASGTKKTLPATGGAQKTPSASAPKSTARQQTPNTSGPLKPRSNNVATGPAKAGGVSAGRTTGTGAVTKPSTVPNDGKVRISPQSRPRVGGVKPAGAGPTTTGATGKKQSSADPLGIGRSFGDISKTKPQPNQSTPTGSKPQARPPQKPSAADPLGIGDNIGGVGKKK